MNICVCGFPTATCVALATLLASPSLAAMAQPVGIPVSPGNLPRWGHDESVQNLQVRLDRATVAVRKLAGDPEFARLLRRARGILIVPDFIKAAAILGSQGGDGVLLVRRRGRWSNPAFYHLGGGSVGLQFGGAHGILALLLMNEKAVSAFETRSSDWNLDSSAGLTVEDHSAVERGSSANGDVIVWSDTHGLLAGVAIGARHIRLDEAANRTYYEDHQVTVQQILSNAIPDPHTSGADLLRRLLRLSSE